MTAVLQLQAASTPSGTPAALQFDRGASRLFHKVLKPASIEQSTITDFRIEGMEFARTAAGAGDDLAGVRVELNPAASGTTQQWVEVLCPCPATMGSPPTLILIDDAIYLGATINGIDCKVKRVPRSYRHGSRASGEL